MALLFFILGALFIYAIVPFIETLLNWFCSWVETRKAIHAEKIHKSNMKIKQDMAQEDKGKRVLGFTISEEENAKDDEDDF